MLNKFPLWKNLLLVAVLILAVIYSLPNLYGEDPAVQVSGNSSKAQVTPELLNKVGNALRQAGINIKAEQIETGNILIIRFYNTDSQFKALPIVRSVIDSENFTAAVNLAAATPQWLQAINAQPMKKGLDLQGGIHFLLDVDVQSAISKRLEGIMRNIPDILRQARLRYSGITNTKENLIVTFKDAQTRDQARTLIAKDYSNLLISTEQKGEQYQLIAKLSPIFLQQTQEFILDQTLTTLRNRVNELGISEPLVQQQGPDQIAIDLPGVQDSTQARQILGGTATVEFHLVDMTHDVATVLSSGAAPTGTRIYYMKDNKRPILLHSQVILSGNSITNASAGIGQDGRPTVDITLGGGGESYFYKTTRENIGNRMAIVYVDTKAETAIVNGKPQKLIKKEESVISDAVIQSALPAQFQITGLQDPKESRNLALLLRAGAMPVNVNIIEERTIGASLGQENIRSGILSVEVAFILIVIFMALYYRVFGLIADIALGINLLLLVAILSILGMTLTLPGIAGIVLTVGMAVDANVLIFERIREELRNGTTTQAAIHAGFARALNTIVDANITTLIVAIVLFSIGSGPIKGFALTLSLGIMTSMFMAIVFTRGIVNLIYGGKANKPLSLGIRY